MTVTKQDLIPLKLQNIKRVEVDFQGGNDEGFIDDIRIEYLNGKKETRTSRNDDVSVDKEILDLVCKPVWDRYHTFAGDFYVAGTVIWQVNEDKVYFQGEQQEMRPFKASILDG